MTNSSAALAFLAGGEQQQPLPQQAPSGEGGSSSSDVAPSSSRSRSTSSMASDLAPSANTFIRKLYQMVTTEDQDIIAFTPGALRAGALFVVGRVLACSHRMLACIP